MRLFPWHRRPGSHVPYESLVELRAAYTPDAVQSVSEHPPNSSQELGQPPVLTSSNPLSTLLQRFACARLSRAVPAGIIAPTFPQRSPPSLLTTAACGGLGSTSDCRTRRALLHLSYSCAPPFGPATLVTQDPKRASDTIHKAKLSSPIRSMLVTTLHPSQGRPRRETRSTRSHQH